MRILMVTQWFDPEPTFKGLLFAQELKRLGHDVRVLTGFPNYPGGTIYPGYAVRPFRREVVGGIPVYRVALYPSHDNSKIKRVLNYLSFAATSALATLFVRRPDVAYVYHPPATVGLPAVFLKLFRGVPFVYDVQDLWPDSLAATGMLDRPKVLNVVGRAMGRIYKSAARIAVLSPGFKDILIDRGVPANQIEVIPNWADEKQIHLAEPTEERARELGFTGKFTVTFAGNMGKAQALETLLDAAKLLSDVPDVRFLLVGGGLEVENLKQKAQELGLANLEFMARRPISEIGEILALSDALIVHLRDDPLFSITIPSKTQAYLMAGRPILMGVRGDAAQIVQDAGAGLGFEPENAGQLADAVQKLMGMSAEELREMGAAGKRSYDQEMALSVGARRFETLLRVAGYLKPRTLGLKRLGDMLASSVGLVILSVPMACLAMLIRKNLGAPVVFTQSRPGRNGVPFQIRKFRSMTDARDANGELLSDGERLTAFGSMLRRTSLDELPELWNVLRGDMSLVGPRPLLIRYTQYFTEEERLRLAVRPGLTGLAQVHGRNTVSWSERLAYDVDYVKNLSVMSDLRILARTFSMVFTRQGVVVDPESTMQNLDVERTRIVAE